MLPIITSLCQLLMFCVYYHLESEDWKCGENESMVKF